MTVDVSEWLKAFDGLDDLKESLARRMGVSAGVIVRDDAKERAPIGDPTEGYDASWKTGSDQPGALRDAIYLAYSDASTETQVVYSVSWNAKKAFWGVFVEFGFVMEHLVLMNRAQNTFWTEKGEARPDGPLRVEATPFLAPALDSNIARIAKAALDRGKIEFPKLLQEIKK